MKKLLTGRELCYLLYRRAVRVETKEPYFGIKVVFPSGSSYWFSDYNDAFNLVHNEGTAKVFLTQGSAERYIKKIQDRHAIICDKFTFEVHQLRAQ